MNRTVEQLNKYHQALALWNEIQDKGQENTLTGKRAWQQLENEWWHLSTPFPPIDKLKFWRNWRQGSRKRVFSK